MAILEIKDLNFSYSGAESYALCDINFSIQSGEFVVICGESGCGKSTLLRLLKKQLQPAGKKSGQLLYQGVEIEHVDERRSITDIGFVMQNPDNQIVTDKVWHELAFGLESLGEDTSSIRRKVAEVSGFFGINEWYRKKTSELSGGQKQLLNLASIMVMQPKVLILDEPTSQLDPIAATEFIAALRKINVELGITIVLVEHRLEEVFPIAHKVILMNHASVLFVDTPRNVGRKLNQIEAGHKMNLGMPSSVRIFNALNVEVDCPLTVREGKDFLQENFKNGVRGLVESPCELAKKEIAIEVKEGYFRYERNLPDVLCGLDLTVYKQELLCILGGNGSGKTTMLRILSGLSKLYRGKLRIWGKKLSEYGDQTLYHHMIAFLPQNPVCLFVKGQVLEDLMEAARLLGYDKVESERRIYELARELEIEKLLKSHPYDLSGGEQQKCALTKILLLEPQIILLDEPTKGIDAYSKQVLAGVMKRLKQQGKTIVMVTHDIEFAAEQADRCAMFFDGQIVSVDKPVEFFSQNNYYTTAASRISRGLFDRAITCHQVIELCQINGLKTEIAQPLV